MATQTPTTNGEQTNGEQSAEYKALWANKYRGVRIVST